MEMVGGCDAELGTAAPWRARPGWHWNVVQGLRRCRRCSPALVLKEEEEVDWAEIWRGNLSETKMDFWIYQGLENLYKEISEEFWHKDFPKFF
jgi:hypothetical protein